MTVRSPGRLEVVGRRPLVVLDGAKNVPGAMAAAAAVQEEWSDVRSRILVVGMLQGRGKDPEEMLRGLDAEKARLVVTCPAPSPRTVPPAELAAGAQRIGVPVEVADSVEEALDQALGAADPEDMILVTGSLYVVGAARTALSRKHEVTGGH
jgi:dihydrofolate synthase/folylpolyglutamate synthase